MLVCGGIGIASLANAPTPCSGFQMIFSKEQSTSHSSASQQSHCFCQWMATTGSASGLICYWFVLAKGKSTMCSRYSNNARGVYECFIEWPIPYLCQIFRLVSSAKWNTSSYETTVSACQSHPAFPCLPCLEHRTERQLWNELCNNIVRHLVSGCW